MNILIGAGHYPARPGVQFEGFSEYAEASLWCDIICRHINYIHRMPDGPTNKKLIYINQKKPLMAIEIHFNDAFSGNRHVGKGSECLYNPRCQTSKMAAEAIQHELGKEFSPCKGIREGWYHNNITYGLDFFLAGTICPAVIIIPEYVINYKKINTYRNNGVLAIIKGIIVAGKRIQNSAG